MINRLKVEALFNHYDYDIDFKANNWFTIMAGPNGSGKTTLLKIIYHLTSGNFWYFNILQFKKILLSFNTGLIVEISKEELVSSDDSDNNISSVLFSFSGHNIKLDKNYVKSLVAAISTEYSIKPSKQDVDYEDFLTLKYKRKDDSSLPDDFRTLQLELNDEHPIFVRYNRLMPVMGEQGGDMDYQIELLSADLKLRYQRASISNSEKIQKLDSTYGSRLVKDQITPYNEGEYHQKVQSLNDKIDEYKRFGLLMGFHADDSYSDKMKLPLTLTLMDLSKKIGYYSEFYSKLSLLNQIIENDGFQNKVMTLSQRGIEFNDSQTGARIPLRRLSSGEQSLLIMFYNMIFKSHEHQSIIMIDEPETSMHPAWLNDMLYNYREVNEVIKCQMIFATHSRDFVDQDWDDTVDLYMQEER